MSNPVRAWAGRRTAGDARVTDPELFLAYKPLLFSIAYRMLGSAADAEDAVQETFLRWHRAQADGTEIHTPKGWLTTTISRTCLDQLGSARAKREQYVGPWLPEPLAGTAPDVAETAADFDSLSTAFLVLLESLAPKERAVFLLHEVFGYDFAAIAEIVGENATNCRQIAKRARAHVTAHRPRFAADTEQRNRLIERFLAAVTDGAMDALIETLSADVTVFSDGGGKVNAARKPVVGRDKVALFLTNLRRMAPEGTRFALAPINGQSGIVTTIEGAVHNVVTFEVDESGIRTIYIVVNPDKLRRVAAAMAGGGVVQVSR
jgi:RNA polymerase sigma-70 factor, ECF subfamily